MVDEPTVTATPITPSAPAVSDTTPVSTPAAPATPANDDFDENIIPEGSRDNFRKYRESQQKKQTEYETKLNAETRKRMEYESRVSDYENRQRQQQTQPVGEKPKYTEFSTVEEYDAALEKYYSAKAVSDYRSNQTQQQKQQQAYDEALRMRAKGVAAMAKYPDFVQVTQPIIQIANNIPVLKQFVEEFDNGTDVLYHLGKNPAVLEGLSKLKPFAAGQELLRIQAALSTPNPKAVSQAPAPINPVNSGGDGSVKSVLEQVKKDDVTDFIERENRKELRKRKGAS